MESFALSFASMLLALAVVLVIAYLLLRVMRGRMQPRGTPGQANDDALRFVRALQVGAKERVVIVEHRGERWMLGVTAGGINTIEHWPASAPRSGDATASHGADAPQARSRSTRDAPNCRTS